MTGKRRAAPPLIDAEYARFVQGGVSVIVASRDANLVPDVVRGCGCRVSRDRRRVTVLVEPARAGSLLDDISTTGMVAVVFSQPSTHRTIQLKGSDARLEPVKASDRRIVARNFDLWVAELVSMGYSPEIAAAVRGRAENGVAAIGFTPTAAFEQTPGPAAGTRLRCRA